GVQVREVNETGDGQRIDNFLIKTLKGVPKSRIYRAIRSGEVRVNGHRTKAESRVYFGEKIRIPPLKVRNPDREPSREAGKSWTIPVVYEDDDILVVDKPSGLPVHAGTRHAYGLIDIMQSRTGQNSQLQLIHRLDLETSGCLLLSKSRQMLLKVHTDIVSTSGIQKQYLALVRGSPKSDQMDIRLALGKTRATDHRVKPDLSGRAAQSVLHVEKRFDSTSLLMIDLVTGRMHQARVHCSESGFPIAGDKRYGDSLFNRVMKSRGLNRLFLHAHRIRFFDLDDKPITVNVPLPKELQNILDLLQPPKGH
ncbi:MAG: RluA family pseudouridine synthase, partial [Gammaproteobacteria bacterium]|nr:RluA family pseudouridine synthase [Gammaproteobacteria bacterium]